MKFRKLLMILSSLSMMLSSLPSHAQSVSKTIQVYGHRGARYWSPENTLPAYKTGMKIGIDCVDMDVNLTKDGVVVVTHDFALNPALTRDAKGQWITKPILIKDLTFKELQTYDVGRLKPGSFYGMDFPQQIPVDGTHISSLKQVIDYVKKHADKNMKFQVELKTDPRHPEWTFSPKKLATATVNVLKEEGVDNRTEMQAFDWRCLYVVQKLDSKIATAYLTDENQAIDMSSPIIAVAGLWTGGYLLKNYDNSIPKMIATLGGKIWGPEYTELTQANVDECHRLGLRVVPWTVDTEAAINKMIDFGVDAIITDRPELARSLIAARQAKAS